MTMPADPAESATCPKCGAAAPRLKSYAEGVPEWECGSWMSQRDGFHQFSDCRIDELTLQLSDALARAERADAEIERLREVWFACDQTIGCAVCGWIDWPGANGETDNTTKPHSSDCPIGYMQARAERAELKSGAIYGIACDLLGREARATADDFREALLIKFPAPLGDSP